MAYPTTAQAPLAFYPRTRGDQANLILKPRIDYCLSNGNIEDYAGRIPHPTLGERDF